MLRYCQLETQERYTIGDGDMLLSTGKATAPIVIAGKKGKIAFSVVP